jgi:hypothetical protein
MKARTLAAIWLSVIFPPSIGMGAQYLLDNVGGKLLDDRGGFLLIQDTPDPNTIVLPPGGQYHSVMQLATWGPKNAGAKKAFISLYYDVKPDLVNIQLMGTASEEGKEIKFVWLYLNNVVVATCPGYHCDYLMPIANMAAGINEILVAYQPDVGPALHSR